MKHYTQEDILNARMIDICDLAHHMGYTVKRVGNFHTLKEHDSVIFFNRTTYSRFSTKTGGDAIQFVREFLNLSFPDAVQYCLDYRGIAPERTFEPVISKEEKSMTLPEQASDYKRLFAYLIKSRCLDRSIVQYAVDHHLIYESKDYHNIVFLSKDKDGNVRHAYMRGTNEYIPFKGDVEGNDKRYGFNIVGSSDHLYVYEGAIDALSDLDMDRDFTVSRLALGMLSDGPLTTFLEEHPDIRYIHFRMDGDKRGMDAMKELSLKYTALGFHTKIEPPHLADGSICKDYNEKLKAERIHLTRQHPKPIAQVR